MNSKQQILDTKAIDRKIDRLAWELYERHSNTEHLYMVGILKNGVWLAQRLKKALEGISGLNITLIEMSIDKDNPEAKDANSDIPEGASIALVDDVLNSGRTLIYAVMRLMRTKPHVLSTTVLVDRNHKRYPVKVDHKGLSLSTTLQERVQLEVNGDSSEVYLK